jgi:hypothetical protein
MRSKSLASALSLVLVGIVCAPVSAAAARSGGARKAPQGPWPTKAMIDVGIDRAVRELAKRFAMDETQAKVLSDDFKKRLPEFLKQHRPVLQKIVNEGLETVITGEKPTPAKVAEWAKAARPVVLALDKELVGTYKEVREVLRPEQVKKWDADYQKYRLGKALALTEIGKLSRGEFNPSTWRHPMPKPKPDRKLMPPPSDRSKKAEAVADASGKSSGSTKGNRFKARGGSQSGPPKIGQSDAVKGGVVVSSRAPRKLSAWESYVKQFIRKHDLDEGRTNSAMAILKDLQEQAATYEAKHKKELERLQKAVTASDSAVRPRVQAQLDELRRPIDELFGELRSRLDGLLTKTERSGRK